MLPPLRQLAAYAKALFTFDAPASSVIFTSALLRDITAFAAR